MTPHKRQVKLRFQPTREINSVSIIILNIYVPYAYNKKKQRVKGLLLM